MSGDVRGTSENVRGRGTRNEHKRKNTNVTINKSIRF